jgi:hypothetical protein
MSATKKRNPEHPFSFILTFFVAGALLLTGCEAKYYEYGSDAHVQKLPPPIDCDFDTAPFGKKGCHYEKRVTLLNAKGEVVGGDEVLPNGNHVFTSPNDAERVTDVLVSWVKINEAEAFLYNQEQEKKTVPGRVGQPAPTSSPRPIDPERQKLIAACIERFKNDPNYQDPYAASQVEATCTAAPNLKP